MATSAAAMKSSLVLVLLLSAVAASYAHEVSCKNSCKDAIWLNGILVLASKSVVLTLDDLELKIVVEVVDTDGGKHSGTYKCPEDVEALEFQFNKVTGFLEVKITAVLRLLGGILESVLGAVFSLIKCNLHY